MQVVCKVLCLCNHTSINVDSTIVTCIVVVLFHGKQLLRQLMGTSLKSLFSIVYVHCTRCVVLL
jgi:hypothetical protein